MRTPRPDLSGASWRKSSYSNAEGGDCLEVAESFPGAPAWRKSSHSNAEGGNCVEVAANHPTLVPVRDSKRPQAPALVVAALAWTAFVAHLRHAEG